jgi:hypothetical protein
MSEHDEQAIVNFFGDAIRDDFDELGAPRAAYFDTVLADVRLQRARVNVEVEFHDGALTGRCGSESYRVGDLGYIVEGLEDLETPAELTARAVKDVLLQGLGLTPPGPLPGGITIAVCGRREI